MIWVAVLMARSRLAPSAMLSERKSKSCRIMRQKLFNPIKIHQNTHFDFRGCVCFQDVQDASEAWCPASVATPRKKFPWHFAPCLAAEVTTKSYFTFYPCPFYILNMFYVTKLLASGGIKPSAPRKLLGVTRASDAFSSSATVFTRSAPQT